MNRFTPARPRARAEFALPPRAIANVVAFAAAYAVASLAFLALSACSNSAASASPASADSTTPHNSNTDSTPTLALPVVAEPARDADLVLRVITTGQIRSDAAVKLRTEVNGTVGTLRVRPGERVAKGQRLLTLDPYPFDLAVREARATVDEAEQRFLESYVPESLVTGHAPTPEQRKSLMSRAGLNGARLKLERATFEQSHATILSPINGMIDAIDITLGERVTSGQPLLTVVDTRNLRIEAQVLEHDLPRLRIGGEARITSAAAPGREITGRIDAVLPLVDSVTRAGRAIVRVGGDGSLRPGMYADVQLEAARLRSRRLVPARAIVERDGRPLVFVVRNGRAQWTYIVPGRTNGRDTEVLPDSATGQIPVQAGDAVIVDGQLTLTHDAPVKVLPPREPSTAAPSANASTATATSANARATARSTRDASRRP